MTDLSEEQTLKDEIASLKNQLSTARAQLNNADLISRPTTTSLLPSHSLLLLADSALPIGSFAFSSGLESYLAHHPPSHNKLAATLPQFLSLSLRSFAAITLPYLIAAYKNPSQLQELDVELDACTLCPVAKRASIAQGRALLTLWERALRSSCATSPTGQALTEFSAAVRTSTNNPCSEEVDDDVPQAHFALIYAAVCAAMSVTLHEAAYTYLFNHAKTVVSAGVRASVTGPYAAQGLLGSQWLQGLIEESMEREWAKGVDEAAQSTVMLDLWVGRHELLYSRIFNS